MKLSSLIEKLNVIELRVNDPELDIAFVTEDSRRCTEGAVFVAVEGTKLDGHDYIEDALSKGVSAVVCERSIHLVDPDERVQNIIRVTNGRFALAELAARLYGEPSRQLRVVGVTGTNGKTTVVSILVEILRLAGINAVGLTTVGTYDGGKYTGECDLTTPDPVFLQKRMVRALREGVSHFAMEVSSHAIAQKRIAKTNFVAGAFTNLTEDHLDFHGDMENYEAAKAEFFRDYLFDPSHHFAVINKDDPVGRKFAAMTGAQVITCSLDDQNADVYARILELTPQGSRFEMALNVSKLSQVTSAWIPQISRASLTVGTGLPGIFNVTNSVIAATLALALGVDVDDVVSGVEAFSGVPGRMERIDEGQKFTVYVDYAHTPDALKNVLEAIRTISQQGGRIILVTGNGGDRDRQKRPLCGAIGAELSDRLILTNDNPRTEDPQQILNDILAGIPGEKMNSLEVIPERRNAIRRAIELAEAGDIVLIAGKGHEDYQIIGTEKQPFDDSVEARISLRERLGTTG